MHARARNRAHTRMILLFIIILLLLICCSRSSRGC
uniref:Envelope glycoprotein n=1 Tax=Microviridae sp. ctpIT6 TaxID=2827650 RepID=A0A8S5SVK6_9VIRU|nr:MAG TPA: envelope glycoprotein [Microviridae sp. ctpIT6]